jgi:hypothetical protein
MPPDFDRHRDLEALLRPWVKMVAKLNVIFIGLAIDLAISTFIQVQVIYTLSGGPSFAIGEFDPDEGSVT